MTNKKYDKSDYDDDEVIGDPSDDEVIFRYDTNGNRYNINAGSEAPVDGRCGGLLKGYSERFHEKRYCTGMPENTFVEDGSDRCKHHKCRDGLRARANELMEHGTFTESIIHLYDKIGPYKQWIGINIYESLLDASVYEFGDESTEKIIDFNKDHEGPDRSHLTADDGLMTLRVSTPSENQERAIPLWQAAMGYIQMVSIEPELIEKNLESKTISDSEYIMPSEDNPKATEGWRELKEMSEHHLNLPLDRLKRTQQDLLEQGGVGIEVDEKDDSTTINNEIVFDPSDTDSVDPEVLNDPEGSKPPISNLG